MTKKAGKRLWEASYWIDHEPEHRGAGTGSSAVTVVVGDFEPIALVPRESRVTGRGRTKKAAMMAALAEAYKIARYRRAHYDGIMREIEKIADRGFDTKKAKEPKDG